jgi:hypothetical protein
MKLRNVYKLTFAKLDIDLGMVNKKGGGVKNDFLRSQGPINM